jgi:hypothetical protein
MILSCAVLAALVFASAEAQDAGPPAKDAITDATIIHSCGSTVSKMFAQYGVPSNVVPIRGNTPAEDDVICDYGTYMFRVRDRVVRLCFFLNGWKGPIRGIKIGDSREDVVKALGPAQMTFKDKNGVVTDYGYRMKDLGVTFYANFDEDGKLKRVEIAALQ